MAELESFAVIGGEGFVGQALVQALLAQHPTQRVASLGLTQRTFSPHYRFFRTDITSLESLSAALRNSGATTVFHTASPHPTATKEVCEAVNVQGTQAVIEACTAAGVRKLVFTSSVTVVFDGTDLIDVDERLPVTESLEDHYVATKVKAERLVLEANGKDGLLTCSLRLAGIFGPGDRQVIPGLIQVLHDRQTSFQMGHNLNLFDFVHVSNVVHAHLLAASRLSFPPVPPTAFESRLSLVNSTNPRRTLPTSISSTPPLPPSPDAPLPASRNRYDQLYSSGPSHAIGVAGEAFFITNGEPVPFWSFVRAVWFAYNGHVPWFVVPLPVRLGLVMGTLAECYHWVRGTPKAEADAGLTRTHVKYVVSNMYFNIEKARRVLGYGPVISLEAGIVDAIQWWKREEAKLKKTQ